MSVKPLKVSSGTFASFDCASVDREAGDMARQTVGGTRAHERNVAEVAQCIGAIVGDRLPEFQELLVGVNATSLVEALKMLTLNDVRSRPRPSVEPAR